MKAIINSIITFLISLVGFIGGLIWGYTTDWQVEPIILISASLLEIIGFFVTKKDAAISKNKQIIINKAEVKKQINIQEYHGEIKM